MKKTGISLTFAVCALILSLLSSCRMNNGDIGDFFGTWYMESMTVDGEPNPELPHERLFWSFQLTITIALTAGVRGRTKVACCTLTLLIVKVMLKAACPLMLRRKF